METTARSRLLVEVNSHIQQLRAQRGHSQELGLIRAEELREEDVVRFAELEDLVTKGYTTSFWIDMDEATAVSDLYPEPEPVTERELSDMTAGRQANQEMKDLVSRLAESVMPQD